jgi:hypothetical protein
LLDRIYAALKVIRQRIERVKPENRTLFWDGTIYGLMDETKSAIDAAAREDED